MRTLVFAAAVLAASTACAQGRVQVLGPYQPTPYGSYTYGGYYSAPVWGYGYGAARGSYAYPRYAYPRYEDYLEDRNYELRRMRRAVERMEREAFYSSRKR